MTGLAQPRCSSWLWVYCVWSLCSCSQNARNPASKDFARALRLRSWASEMKFSTVSPRICRRMRKVGLWMVSFNMQYLVLVLVRLLWLYLLHLYTSTNRINYHWLVPPPRHASNTQLILFQSKSGSAAFMIEPRSGSNDLGGMRTVIHGQCSCRVSTFCISQQVFNK